MRTMLIYTQPPPPGLVVRGPAAPDGPPAASGEVCGTITCYYDFLGNVYIFTITQPLSFIFHENWREINDGAPEETEHHATLIYRALSVDEAANKSQTDVAAAFFFIKTNSFLHFNHFVHRRPAHATEGVLARGLLSGGGGAQARAGGPPASSCPAPTPGSGQEEGMRSPRLLFRATWVPAVGLW